MRPEALVRVVQETSQDPRTCAAVRRAAPAFSMSSDVWPSRKFTTMRSKIVFNRSCSACTSARATRAEARHVARVRVAERKQLRERVDAAAEPTAAEPVEHGIALRRNDVADGDDVRVGKTHVERRRRCAPRSGSRTRCAVSPIVSEPVSKKCLRGRAGGRQRRLVAILGRHVPARTTALARLLVRDDRRAGASRAPRSRRSGRGANAC